MVTVTEAPAPPLEVKWRLVLEKTYPDAWWFVGKCTHEDTAFLVDPFTILRGAEDWAKTDLVKRVEDEYAAKGVKPLRLKVYVGEEEVLWGLLRWPAVRVESWHASPGITLILALIVAALVALAIIIFLLYKIAKEESWFGLGLLIVGGGVVLYLLTRERRRE